MRHKDLWIKKENKIIKMRSAWFFKNLDALPLPAKDIFKDLVNATGIYMTMASLGCPNECTFCYNYQELYKHKGIS